MAQNYYDANGDLMIWTGTGYHRIPAILASDWGERNAIRWDPNISGGGDQLGNWINEQRYGFADSADGDTYNAMMAKYGFPTDTNNMYFFGDKDKIGATLKSGDKVGTQIEWTLDPATGKYIPKLNGEQSWNTNQAENNWAGFLSALAMAGAGAGAAGAFGAAGAPAAGGAGGAAGSSGYSTAYGVLPPASELGSMGGVPAVSGVGTSSPWGTAAEWGGAAPGTSSAPSAGGSFWDKLGSVFGGGSGTGGTGGSGMSSWASTIKDWLPLVSAVGGAFQGSQDQTVTNKTELPPWLQALGPALTNASVNAAAQPFQPYPGQRIEPFNPAQQTAFGMTANRALNGSPVEMAGQNAVTRAAMGNANPMFGLDNPYLNKQIDNTLGDLNRNFERTVLPNIDAMNVRANTGFGTSSAVNGPGGIRSEAYKNLNDTAAKTANDMRYKDYYTQAQLGEGMAGRQLQAAGLAPNLGALDYRNIDALLGVGNQQQQLGQSGRDFNYQEFLRQLQYPDLQLQRLGYPFGFNQGMTSSTTTPGVGAVAGGISGLLGGYGMSNMVGRPGTAVTNASTMTPPPSTGTRLDQYYPYQWGVA